MLARLQGKGEAAPRPLIQSLILCWIPPMGSVGSLISDRSTKRIPLRARRGGLRGRCGGLCVRLVAMLVAMWVGWSAAAHATPPERPWTSLAHPPSFEHVSVEQGLSQSSVHTIAQDKLGFLWMGTDTG